MINKKSRPMHPICWFVLGIAALLCAVPAWANETSPLEKLLAAAAEGDRDLVDRLLEMDVDINGRGKAGMTALHLARVRGQVEMAEHLIARGADESIEFPAFAKVADQMLSHADKENSPGIALLVSRDGEIVYKSGHGFASLEHRAKVTPHTKFRIGSITKQFTAAAILTLQEEGKLNVEDTLDKFFPDFPRGDEVTLRHLLHHTSGIHSYTSKPAFVAGVSSYIEADALIASFQNDPFDFDPGKEWSYNNSGYFLLGRIVEKASGQSYAEFLRESFFEPLKMHDTGVHHWKKILPDEATGYAWEEGSLHKALNWDMSQAGGAGALYSTVEDLFRWNEAIFTGKVLSQESLEAAFTPVEVAAGKNSMPYGYGWVISKQRGLACINHGGGLFGFASHLARYPQHNVTVVALVNAQPGPPGLNPTLISNEAAQLLLWDKMQARADLAVDASVTAEMLAGYVGRYDYQGAVMTVTQEGKRLFAQLTGQSRHEIFPTSESEFFWKVVDAQVTFVKDDKGQVTHAVHRQSSVEFKAPKLAPRTPVELPPKQLDKFVGKYDYGGGVAIMTVTRDGKQLFAQLTGQPKLEIVAFSETEFFWKAVAAEVKFVPGEDGKVTKAIHKQGGRTIEAPRIKEQ